MVFSLLLAQALVDKCVTTLYSKGAILEPLYMYYPLFINMNPDTVQPLKRYRSPLSYNTVTQCYIILPYNTGSFTTLDDGVMPHLAYQRRQDDVIIKSCK